MHTNGCIFRDNSQIHIFDEGRWEISRNSYKGKKQ